MSKLTIVTTAIFLLFASSLSVDGQVRRLRSTTADDGETITSPNHRYLIRFSGARSDGDASGKLRTTISIRDLRTGRERTVRIAGGERGKGVFEAFSLYDDSIAWSPDGLYLAYWDDYCVDEPAVSSGVVCHLHEIHFLNLRKTPRCREELVLGRYGFGGWARGRGHTVLEILINEDGKTVRRSPCVKRRQ